MRKLILLAALVALAGCKSEGSVVDSGKPPTRFQGDVTATSVIFTKDYAEACAYAGLAEVPDTDVIACSLVGRNIKGIIIRNPCTAPGTYARDLCHEIGHLNGWPADHGK